MVPCTAFQISVFLVAVGEGGERGSNKRVGRVRGESAGRVGGEGDWRE